MPTIDGNILSPQASTNNTKTVVAVAGSLLVTAAAISAIALIIFCPLAATILTYQIGTSAALIFFGASAVSGTLYPLVQLIKYVFSKNIKEETVPFVDPETIPDARAANTHEEETSSLEVSSIPLPIVEPVVVAPQQEVDGRADILQQEDTSSLSDSFSTCLGGDDDPRDFYLATQKKTDATPSLRDSPLIPLSFSPIDHIAQKEATSGSRDALLPSSNIDSKNVEPTAVPEAVSPPISPLQAEQRPRSKREILDNQLFVKVSEIVKKINFRCQSQLNCGFTDSISEYMVYADEDNYILMCPLFFIELSEMPSEFRPTGCDDSRIYKPNFLQKISDWISDTYGFEKITVELRQCAAMRTILRIKSDLNDGKKAVEALLACKLAHLELGHYRSGEKLTLEQRIKADEYVIDRLGKEGLEGMKFGFQVLRETLKELRPKITWCDGAEMNGLYYMIDAQTGSCPFLEKMTGGSFESRITNMEKALERRQKKE